MNKLRNKILTGLSFLTLLITLISSSLFTTAKASWYSDIICGIDNLMDAQVGETILKVAETEWLDYLTYSVPTAARSEEVDKNLYNSIMGTAGYKFGEENQAATMNPFDKFGFAGMTYSSYYGEWKYYDVNVCEEDKEDVISSNLGEYYEGRRDPLSVWSERISSKDVRTLQTFNSRFWLSLRNLFNTMFFALSKLLLSLAIALTGFTFGDVGELIGISSDFANQMFQTLYSNFFLPMQGMMIVLTAIYLMWVGLVKRAYREAFQDGILKPFVCMILISFMLLNRDMITWPNKIASLGQSFVFSALQSQAGKGSETEFCATSVGVEEINTGNVLDGASNYMRSVLGCRMWFEFGFKPWVVGQFGKEYNELDELDNVNKSWVDEPKVRLGAEEESTITNWALFQLSTQTNLHVPIDEKNTALVNGLNKDWFRIVDALSNYDEEEIDGGSISGSDGSSGSGGDVGLDDDWLKDGTEANEQAKQAIEFFKELGWSGEGIAGVLGNIYAESKFIPDIQEGGGRFGMKNKNHNGFIVMYPSSDWNPSGLGGGGVFQFTPYTKYSHEKWFDKCGWCTSGQMEYVWIDYNGAATQGGLARTLAGNPEFVSMTASSTNIEEATYGFFYVVENAQPREVFEGNVVHGDVRKAAARKAYEHFKLSEIKFDKNKFEEAIKKATGSGSNGSSSSGSGSDSGFGGKVFKQKDTVPLEEWGYWVGNQQGHRFVQAFTSMALTIFGSIPIIIMALSAAVYGLAITLITSVAPVFLLFGLWGGKGTRILNDYIGLLASTIIKRVLAGFLTVVIVILITNMMSMINELGFIKGFLVSAVIIILLVKNRAQILNTLSRVNIGNMDGLTNSFNKGLNVAKSTAKTTAEVGVGAISGGISAGKRTGTVAGGAKGAVRGGGSVIKDKIKWETEVGRKFNTAYNAGHKTSKQSDDDRVLNATIIDPTTGEEKARTCDVCGRVIEEGEYIYQTFKEEYYGMWVCQSCLDTEVDPDLLETYSYKLDNVRDNEYRVSPTTTIYHNGKKVVYKQPSNASLAKLIGAKRVDKDGLQEQMNLSMKKWNYDLTQIEAYAQADGNSTYSIRNTEMSDFLAKHINVKDLNEALIAGDKNRILSIYGHAWADYYKSITESRQGFTSEDKEFINRFLSENGIDVEDQSIEGAETIDE